MILWGSTGGGVSKGHYTENVHKTLSRAALRSFCSLKTYFFLEEGVSTIMMCFVDEQIMIILDAIPMKTKKK